ncbi:MAG: hypothetical protein K8T25_00445 [Planctomycetia bacterium]|nr:hypothetical protein [Planctomycetia bacterium]
MRDNASSIVVPPAPFGIQLLFKLLKLLRVEFFSDRVQATLTLTQLAISLVSAIGAFVGLIELEAKWQLATQSQFHFYLWLTFVSSVLFVAFTLALLQHAWRMSLRVRKEQELFNRATKLQHHMIEQVRQATADGSGYSMRTGLENVLGAQLVEYLRLVSGLQEFHVTVKTISPKADGSGHQLTDNFRDKEQSPLMRPLGQCEGLSENYIYHRFKNATLADSRQIYVCDTELDPVHLTLRERAHTRGYRSVIAFPLNVPASPQPTSLQVFGLTGLIGFLGLDSPQPHAFDSLCSPKKTDTTDASVHSKTHNLDLFYGLADSVATIAMTLSHPIKDGTPGGDA